LTLPRLGCTAGVCCVLLACSSSNAPPADGRLDAPRDAGREAHHDVLTDARLEARGPDTTPTCAAGASSCVDHGHQKVCRDLGGGQLGWVTEACASNARCLDTSCATECNDQCNLGDKRTVSGVTQECLLYSMAKDGPTSPGKGLHDRSRQYNAWLRAWHLPGGTVADARFADTTYQKVNGWDGTGDSAIWTGSYLAAEALRLKVTGSPDAAANVEALVDAIHRLFEVTGYAGYLARYTASLGVDPRIDAQFDLQSPEHHKVTYQGKDYVWKGNTSRDQYQGPLLGYPLAYDALTSTKHRQLIRDDMVTLATELIKQRPQTQLTVRFAVSGTWLELPLQVNLQYVVLNPSEYKNGGPFIRVGSESNPTDYESSQLYGVREFLPDFQQVLKQVPVIGPIVPAIPRAGSAIMLASILRIALLVTENEPAYASARQTIKDHYDQNIAAWLGVMKQWGFINAAQCWKSYFGLNIDFEPVYNLVRLEPDLTLRASFQQEVLEGKMWPVVQDHKNVFFSFIHASQATPSPTVQGIVNAATLQLDQFPPPPHAHVAVDNSGKYPANAQCPGQSSVAVDVADRVASDFIWQRDPFGLATGGDPTKVYPGVDYLLAYWLGRRHGFIADDGTGTCLRWQ